MRIPNIGNVAVASYCLCQWPWPPWQPRPPLALLEPGGIPGHTGREPVALVLSPDTETARGSLSAIATAVATIAATTFSLTIVALTLATPSSKTPKLLHNYMSNRGNQATLGVLAGTFAYAILVLSPSAADLALRAGATSPARLRWRSPASAS